MSGRIAVIGDTLLDVDVLGRVERVSPDAPAPVVDQLSEHPRPGGAGLAAALAAADGCEVVLITGICGDALGRQLTDLLQPRVRLIALPLEGATVVKRRIRAAGQTLLRIDAGAQYAPPGLPDPALQALHDADAILVSDYGHGVASAESIREALRTVATGIPLVWDPHPRGQAPSAGSRLATPNLAESARAVGVAQPTTVPGVADLADRLVARWQVSAVAVTLGASGALLSYGHGAPTLVPADSVIAVDPCGAGDRFAAAAAMTLAAGGITLEAVEAGVCAATAFVAAGGAAAFGQTWTTPTAVPTSGTDVDAILAAVRARQGTVVATGGCFDLLHAGHVATLQAARRLGDCLVVCLNSDASVRRLKGPGRPLVPAVDRARLLTALACVDAVVVFDEDTPVQALRWVRPDIWAKGGDYRGVDLPEHSVLREWGGAAVVLPYLDGRSTTQLVRTAVGGGSTSTEEDIR